MRHVLSCGAAVIALLMAAPLDAKPGRGGGNGNGHSNGNGNGHSNGNGNGKGGGQAVAAQECPPGLAHRDLPCVPPGQARRNGEQTEERHREASSDGGSQSRSAVEEVWPVLVSLRPLTRPYLPDDSEALDGPETLALAPAAVDPGPALVEMGNFGPEPVAVREPSAAVDPAPTLIEVPDLAPEPVAVLEPPAASAVEPVIEATEETAEVAPAVLDSSEIGAALEAAAAEGATGF